MPERDLIPLYSEDENASHLATVTLANPLMWLNLNISSLIINSLVLVIRDSKLIVSHLSQSHHHYKFFVSLESNSDQPGKSFLFTFSKPRTRSVARVL